MAARLRALMGNGGDDGGSNDTGSGDAEGGARSRSPPPPAGTAPMAVVGKWIDAKGYGFGVRVTGDPPQTSMVLLHRNQIMGDERQLKPGTGVDFDLDTTAAGKLTASNIVVVAHGLPVPPCDELNDGTKPAAKRGHEGPASPPNASGAKRRRRKGGRGVGPDERCHDPSVSRGGGRARGRVDEHAGLPKEGGGRGKVFIRLAREEKKEKQPSVRPAREQPVTLTPEQQMGNIFAQMLTKMASK